MRTLFIAILFILFTVSLSAQTSDCKQYSVSASVGTGIVMSKPSTTPFTLNINGYYSFTERWSAGAGTGYSLYDSESLIPIYAVGQYTMRPSFRLNPFIDCSVGYAFAPDSNVNGGLLLNPSVGVQYKLWGKQFILGVGHQLQKLERKKATVNSYFSAEFEEKISFSSISFKLGIKF